MTLTPNAPPGLTLAAVVLLAGCSQAPAARPAATPATAPPAAGGCAGTTVMVGGAPPTWALAGFTGGSVGELPWALGSPPDVVAYLFATQLVAAGQRPDGTSNKILWVIRDPSRVVTIEGRPLGRSQPVVPVSADITNGNQLPSQVDVPTPGCWSFRVSWTASARHTSTIDLDVLPAGTLPLRPSPGPPHPLARPAAHRRTVSSA